MIEAKQRRPGGWGQRNCKVYWCMGRRMSMAMMCEDGNTRDAEAEIYYGKRFKRARAKAEAVALEVPVTAIFNVTVIVPLNSTLVG